MSAHNKVVWSEGLFLQPQHFQQQDRHFERYVESRCEALVPFGWGFAELEVDADLLGLGKLGLRRASGVFPDGTPFQMPDDDPLPVPIDIGPDVKDQIVHLAVMLRRPGVAEAGDGPAAVNGSVRHSVRRIDAAPTSPEPVMLDVAALGCRLLLESERTEAYSCIPVAHVVECRTDRQVVLSDSFMPTVLRLRASTRLAAFTSQLVGKLHHRGEALSGLATATAATATAQLQDYLTLQAINRHEPLLTHFNEAGIHHPESLYRLFVELAGELCTYYRKERRPPALPPYRHERLRESFEPVMVLLDQLLSRAIDPTAIRIPIEPRRHGIFVATVADRSLFSNAVFVLAATADVPAEDFRRRFPSQLKLGPVERIRDLVMLALTGVPVTPLPAVPRQIPFHKGYSYFELDQSHELWSQLPTSGGVALHAGEFPGLTMEFWAIRTER